MNYDYIYGHNLHNTLVSIKKLTLHLAGNILQKSFANYPFIGSLIEWNEQERVQ
jgi:hypothetical protein